MDSDLRKAEQAWDSIDITKVRDVSWLSLPGSHDYFLSVSNNRTIDEIIGSHVHSPVRGIAAAIACGDMMGESTVLDSHEISEIHGFDMSNESLNRAVNLYETRQSKFLPFKVDCNELRLSPNTYDFVLGWHGIHHIKNIEQLFFEINLSLKDNGVFLMYEWIGPEYLQIPAKNAIIARSLLETLFSSDQRTTHQGKIKGSWLQLLPSEFDPSEAINSTAILPNLIKRFEILEILKFGGLMYPIFEGLGANNALVNDPQIQEKTRRIYELEQTLIKEEEIEPLFMISLAKKR